MSDEPHLDEFQAYLLAENRSPVTIAGYVGDVRLFAKWYVEDAIYCFWMIADGRKLISFVQSCRPGKGGTGVINRDIF